MASTKKVGHSPAMPDGERVESVQELVERCRGGDEAAWCRLIRTFSQLAWTVAKSFRLRDAECEDVCQQTWLRVYENIDALTRPDRIAAWIVTTARHESLRVLSRGRRYLPVEDMSCLLPLDDPTRTPEEEAVSRAEQDTVWHAFTGLPDQHQALLALLIADPPPSYDEISVLLAMPRGSIGPTRRRVLGALRESMRRADSERPDGAVRAVPEHRASQNSQTAQTPQTGQTTQAGQSTQTTQSPCPAQNAPACQNKPSVQNVQSVPSQRRGRGTVPALAQT